MNWLGLKMKLATGFGMLLATLILLGGNSYYSASRVTAATEEANALLKKKEQAILSEVAVRKQIQVANDYVSMAMLILYSATRTANKKLNRNSENWTQS